MRKYSLTLLAAAALGLAASAASAADLPRKAPVYAPPAPPPFSWTGFYVGLAGGAGWGTTEVGDPNQICFTDGCTLLDSVGTFAQTQLNGWLFGGTVGYNWQINPWMVLGLEGDFDWVNFEGTSPCGTTIFTFEFASTCHTKAKWTADLTGRVGFAVDRALLYLKGGAVWKKADHDATFNEVGLGCFVCLGYTDTRVGGLFGAGIEYAFLPNWSAKIEYNYMDFGTNNVNVAGFFDGTEPITATVPVREVIHTVKAGVNYRFDWGRY